MGRREKEIGELSRRLQSNLLALAGNATAAPPPFRWQLLIPVALIVGVVAVLGMSTNSRKRAALRIALLVLQSLIVAVRSDAALAGNTE